MYRCSGMLRKRIQRTRAYRSFWMQSSSICLLLLISLRLRVWIWKATKIVRHSSDEEPFSALAFKIMTDPFVGKLAYFRVYSGTMNAGSYVLNATKDKKERVGRILQMHANKRMQSWKRFTPVISLQQLASSLPQPVIPSVMSSIR